MLTEPAPAKLNLALHVRARRADGYHELETLFAFCEHGDALHAEPADDLSLAITGPFAPGLDTDDNLVLRAARALGAGRGARLTLDKHLPVASGLGGGSADAAAALRLLDRLWGLGRTHAELLALAVPLGADVPACVLSRTARGEGKGDALTPSRHPFGPAPLLLVNPRVPVPTGPVFADWDGVDSGPLGEDPAQWRNDLQTPAIRIAPAIGDVLTFLDAQLGVVLARMSGSGATCFALFDGEAARDEAGRRLAREHPDWWRLATRLRAD